MIQSPKALLRACIIECPCEVEDCRLLLYNCIVIGLKKSFREACFFWILWGNDLDLWNSWLSSWYNITLSVSILPCLIPAYISLKELQALSPITTTEIAVALDFVWCLLDRLALYERLSSFSGCRMLMWSLLLIFWLLFYFLQHLVFSTTF